jgi:heme/copper-type cytochrome/quinol oxidase subunit 1
VAHGMPVFVWMALETQALAVLAFPPLTVAMILLMFDRFVGIRTRVPIPSSGSISSGYLAIPRSTS